MNFSSSPSFSSSPRCVSLAFAGGLRRRLEQHLEPQPAPEVEPVVEPVVQAEPEQVKTGTEALQS